MSNYHLSPIQIDRYLQRQLSPDEAVLIENHLRGCRQCQQQVDTLRQVDGQLASTLKSVLGQPQPPHQLRQQVRQQLEASQTSPRQVNPFGPAFFRLLNAAGTFAIIGLLAFVTWQIMRTTPSTPAISVASPTETVEREPATTTPIATSTALSPTPTATILNTPTPKSSDFGLTNTATPIPTATPSPTSTVKPTETATTMPPSATPTPPPPTGLIAFSFYNAAPERQAYEIHLISPDGQNHRLFGLDGVSEPSLGVSDEGVHLAFRAWPGPTEPRALLQSKLDGSDQTLIGGFWEDAQPDWSPDGKRIIYASQREQDRRWRLYTNTDHGQQERTLGLEGKQPSFAPDGERFVYEGCDPTGNRCGLWQATVDNAAQMTTPILEDEQATAPDWSPVSDQIVYMMHVEGNWDIYLVSVDGTTQRRLTTEAAIDGLPTWSPDGQWLAFLSNRGGNWGIWRLHLQTGQLAQIFAFDGGIFTPPHGEPYGQRNWWDEQLSWVQP